MRQRFGFGYGLAFTKPRRLRPCLKVTIRFTVSVGKCFFQPFSVCLRCNFNFTVGIGFGIAFAKQVTFPFRFSFSIPFTVGFSITVAISQFKYQRFNLALGFAKP